MQFDKNEASVAEFFFMQRKRTIYETKGTAAKSMSVQKNEFLSGNSRFVTTCTILYETLDRQPEFSPAKHAVVLSSNFHCIDEHARLP